MCQVLSLADACAQHLALRVTPHNCVAWLQIADALPSAASALRAPCFALVCAQLHRLPSRALLSYPSTLLCDILLSDLLTVPNELFVLQLALDWMLASDVRLHPTFCNCYALVSSSPPICFICCAGFLSLSLNCTISLNCTLVIVPPRAPGTHG
jgi:hypothetical protein